MTFGGPNPDPGWWAPVPYPEPVRRPRLVLPAILAGILLVAATVTAVVTGHHHDRAYRAGDCVVVTSAAAGELHAARVNCDTDPSFTVAKLTSRAGDCAPDDYDRFVPPSADTGTGRLCLVPNLVVGHCYRLGIAVGIWNLVNCAGAGPATIQVTGRLDTADPSACGTGLPARSYPAPPRTYCLGLVT